VWPCRKFFFFGVFCHRSSVSRCCACQKNACSNRRCGCVRAGKRCSSCSRPECRNAPEPGESDDGGSRDDNSDSGSSNGGGGADGGERPKPGSDQKASRRPGGAGSGGQRGHGRGGGAKNAADEVPRADLACAAQRPVGDVGRAARRGGQVPWWHSRCSFTKSVC
jgi:hypothetical protein